MTLLSRQTNFPYLSVPFHEIQTFDPEFAEDVLENPKQILSAGSKTLMEICRERGEEMNRYPTRCRSRQIDVTFYSIRQQVHFGISSLVQCRMSVDGALHP